MRFLKNKIALAQKVLEKSQYSPNLQKEEAEVSRKAEEVSQQNIEEDIHKLALTKNSPQHSPKSSNSHASIEKSQLCSNIVRNYSRGLTNFAASTIAEPYLVSILTREG